VIGLLGTMSTHEFIKQNKDRILNIDGNLNDGNITVKGNNGNLEFYYFEDSKLVSSKVKKPSWRD
jgi:hypothetical protein